MSNTWTMLELHAEEMDRLVSEVQEFASKFGFTPNSIVISESHSIARQYPKPCKGIIHLFGIPVRILGRDESLVALVLERNDDTG